MQETLDKYLPVIQEGAITYGMMGLKALVIFIIGRWIAKWIAHGIAKLMDRSNMDPMLSKFLKNIVYALLLTFVVIAAIGALGIQTASLVAIIGAAGLAVGLALQGSLANFAAGVLIIIFRPYKIGDLVEIAMTEGFVEEVDVFTTVLRTPDKTKIIVPNGQAMAGIITNYTEAEKRRLDLTIGISYDAEINVARQAILEGLKQSEYVLADPAPSVTVAELADNSVNLAVRPWVDSQSYAPASHDVTEHIKNALDKAGVGIPYPQRDVHLYQHSA